MGVAHRPATAPVYLDELPGYEVHLVVDPRDPDRAVVTIADPDTRSTFRAPATRVDGRWVLGSGAPPQPKVIPVEITAAGRRALMDGAGA